jgi:hypothetical protein
MSPTDSDHSSASYYDSDYSSSSTAASANAMMNTFDSKPPYKHSNLHDQLLTSPNTRFHAAYLLLRYCFLIIGSNGDCILNGGDSDSEGTALIAEAHGSH